MGKIDLGRVQGHSISKIVRVSEQGGIDTYNVVLDDNTVAGQFTVRNGVDGNDGANGRDGRDGAPGKDGTLISVNGKLVSTFNADNKSDLPIDGLASSKTNVPLSANMGRKLDMEKAPTKHDSSSDIYGVGTASVYGHVKASSVAPRMDGERSYVGDDNGYYAREGHVHPTDTSRAAKNHTHNVSDITAGILPVSRGGTGKASFPSGAVLVGNGAEGLNTINQSAMTVGNALSANRALNADKASRADQATRATKADSADRATYSDKVYTNLGETKIYVNNINWAPGKDDQKYSISPGFSVKGAVVSAKSKSYYGAGPVLAVEIYNTSVNVVIDNDGGDLAGFCIIIWGK